MKSNLTFDEVSGIVRAIRREGQVTIVQLTGDIDLHRSIPLRGCLLEILAEKPALLVVDMSGVDFMDSSGLATLIEALQVSRRDQAQFRLCGLQPRVKSIFEISRLEKIFTIFPTQAESLKLDAD